MKNKLDKIEYGIQVYTDYVDNPIAYSNIFEFNIDDLLNHPNPKAREFTLILIYKLTTSGNSTKIEPLIVIYNKNNWYVNYEFYKSGNKRKIKTYCKNRKQGLNFYDELLKVECKNINEIVERYNFISKVINTQNKVKSKILRRNNK